MLHEPVAKRVLFIRKADISKTLTDDILVRD